MVRRIAAGLPRRTPSTGSMLPVRANARANFGADRREIHHMVDVEDVDAKVGDAGQQVRDVAADVQLDEPPSCRMADIRRFSRGWISFRRCGRDLAGDRVADANRVGPGVDLDPGELDGDIDAQVHQFGGERWVFQKIDQERRDAAQVGRLGGRPFNPAEDRVLTAILRPVGADGFNAVAHAYGGQRVRRPRRDRSFESASGVVRAARRRGRT